MGSPREPSSPILTLTSEVIDVDAVVAAVNRPDCGALVNFIGVVRNEHRGRQVLRLDYEAYEPMALREMRHIAETVEERWSVRQVAIVHRLGTLEIGEASILIALALPHRKESFAALQYAIDRFKETVPIWKHEFFADGSDVWVEGS